MKTLGKLIFALLIVAGSVTIANAQQTGKDRKAAKVAKIKALINSRNYVFEANYVIPQRGGARSLSFGYDMVVSKDTVTTYLPYFGRVTIAPSDPTDGGIKIKSTNFDYVTAPGKRGSYEITITPKETDTQGSKDVRYFKLSVSADGYASLQVVSNNRDPISFNGTIEPRNPKANN